MALLSLRRNALRTRLASVISHPRVAVSLIAAGLLLASLVVLRPSLSGAPADRLRLATAASTPSSYRAFTSTDLTFAPGPGTVSWGGRRYQYATWTSPWQTPTGAFTQLVPSWNATTPAGSAIAVSVQVRNDSGRTSSVKGLGHWALSDATTKRASAGTQSDDVAEVATDTVRATGRALSAYRFAVRLLRPAGGTLPTLHSIGAVTSSPTTAVATTSKPWQKSAVSLPVPTYSQMIHRGHAPQYGGGGEAWCSPTSLSMVLGYYGRLPAAASYTWVPKSYSDRFVEHVARLTYDYAYDGTGNWPFNTGYAATRTGNAFVTRLANLRMAERFIRAGIPVITSIRFARGQLHNAPISASNGHLVVLVGFTPTGDPIVNDPAAPTDTSVRRTYDRTEFEQAWLRGSFGAAYIVYDHKHPLPKRPTGVTNW